MITLTREEAQQVLDALEYNQANWQGKDKAIEALRARLSQCERCGEVNPAEIHTCTPKQAYPEDFIAALRYHTAIQEQPDIPNNLPIANLKQDELMYSTPPQKPVAWLYEGSDVEGRHVCLDEDIFEEQKPNCIPLYTAPPQREWQGLTDGEVMSLLPGAVRLPPGWVDTVRAIEQALKDKNI